MKAQQSFTKLAAVCMVLLCTSCGGGDLNRAKAEKMITAFYKYPNVEVHETGLSMAFGGEDRLRLLIEGGYVAVPRGFSITPPDMEITEKGKKYHIAEITERGYSKDKFATNMRKLKEVTGIRFEGDEKTKAVVEFTAIRYAITPFGTQEKFTEGEEIHYIVNMATHK